MRWVIFSEVTSSIMTYMYYIMTSCDVIYYLEWKWRWCFYVMGSHMNKIWHKDIVSYNLHIKNMWKRKVERNQWKIKLLHVRERVKIPKVVLVFSSTNIRGILSDAKALLYKLCRTLDILWKMLILE